MKRNIGGKVIDFDALPSRINGKPLAYWQQKADELVLYNLVKGLVKASETVDLQSVTGCLAVQKLQPIVQGLLTSMTVGVPEKILRNVCRDGGFHPSIFRLEVKEDRKGKKRK